MTRMATLAARKKRATGARPVNILGINSVYHESAAALLVDGKLVVAVEEERFNRIKHGKSAEFDNPHQLPERAIRFCLKHAGLDRRRYRSRGLFVRTPSCAASNIAPEWWDPRFEETFRLRLGQVRERCRGASWPSASGKSFISCPTIWRMPRSAYFPSGFDRAAILTIDGIGEIAGSSLAKAVGTRIQLVETFDYPHSLGFLWEVISSHLGFSHYDASKVMGLAAYGNPEIFRRKFQSALRVGKEDYAVSPDFLGFNSNQFAKLDAVVRSAAVRWIPRFCRAMPISRQRCRRRPMRRCWRWYGVSSARCRSTNCALPAASRSIA